MDVLSAAPLVPLLAAATTLRWSSPELPSGIPHAFVDATDRPELWDVGRVLASDGAAFVATQWHRDPQHGAEILEVELLRPVRCRFAISFGVETHRLFLDALPRERRLCIVMVAAGDLRGYLTLDFS